MTPDAPAGVGGSQRFQRVEKLLPPLAGIVDPKLRIAIVEIWVEAWDESDWADLTDVPKGIYGRGSDVGSLIEHVLCVTEAAEALAEVLEASGRGWSVSRDLLLAGALLHDVSKVVESEPGPDGAPVTSAVGRMLQHGVWTAARVLRRDLDLELAHMIVSHTPRSKSVPATLEGLILYYADMMDSDALALSARLPLLIQK